MGLGGLVAWPQRPFYALLANLIPDNPHDNRPLIASAAFPRDAWNPDLFALSILSEFARSPWPDAIKLDAPPASDDDRTRREIETLLALARDERPSRAEEIIDQNAAFHEYFSHVLMISPISHPETFKLFKSAARVAEMIMIECKLRHERPRPQQVFPGLVPILDAPGHSSYPSGHALISRMMALCLGEVAPQARVVLDALAVRIAHNREIGGLHFPSDTEAGFQAAEQAFPLLQACPRYQDVLERASLEWPTRKGDEVGRGR